jgi:HK97 gp10 family phage protein
MTLHSRIPQFLRSTEARAIEAVQLAGERVERSAREHAPGRGPEGEIGQGIQWHPNPGGLSGRVDATDWRSHFFEFGTVKMSARPMLTPAAEEHKDLVVIQVRKVLR